MLLLVGLFDIPYRMSGRVSESQDDILSCRKAGSLSE